MNATTATHSEAWLDAVAFNSDGLIPAIAQDAHTGRILMVAWMNRASLKKTHEINQAVYFSRSRKKLWHKGESSGHFQDIHEIRLDCDNDVICIQVTQHGGIACHTGRQSCFYRTLTNGAWVTVDSVIKDPDAIYGDDGKSGTQDTPKDSANSNDDALAESADVLTALNAIIKSRQHADASSSYVASLYQKGLNKILEKIGEECTEAIIAAKDLQGTKDEERSQALIYEVADLWFHTLVALTVFDISPKAITDELARRFGVSGIAEKKSRQT